MKSRKAVVMRVICGVVALLAVVARGEIFIPDGKIRGDDYTVLMAVDAPLPLGCKKFGPSGHGKFYVYEWRRSSQLFYWEVEGEQAGDYHVNVLLSCNNKSALRVRVSCAGSSVDGVLEGAAGRWRRLALDGLLRIPAGRHTVKLEALEPEFAASVMSLELVVPDVRERLHKAALAQRSDTGWMVEARYGIMCHWTSQSCPRYGEPLPYSEAVKRFDVAKMVEQVAATGAGFLVLTTSHGEMYFPAPIKALDRILTGRTAERDLVAELAAELAKRNIKLMLYYHLGADSDPAWLGVSGFWESDTTKFFNNWCAVVGEVGERYGDKLVGWWFDDGLCTYYYRSPVWERLAAVAKYGYAGRVIAFNPWVLPLPTEFQDYHTGENLYDPASNVDMRDGLLGCATIVSEQGWGHFGRDAEIGGLRWSAEELAGSMKRFVEHGVVPMYNLEIYQDGSFSPHTIEVFRRAVRLFSEAAQRE